MALIVEDGTVVTSANSYVTLAQADAYFASVNNTTWDALDDTDEKIPFLIAAVRFMQQTYRQRWNGYRNLSTQSLDWPRSYVPYEDTLIGFGVSPYLFASTANEQFPYYYSNTTIPQEIKDAQCELALRVAAGDLNPDISPEDSALMTKVGPITIQYNKNAPVATLFVAVDLLLKPFFKSQGINTRINRS